MTSKPVLQAQLTLTEIMWTRPATVRIFTGASLAPTVTEILPAENSVLSTSSVDIDVTFSETVTGVEASDLVLSGPAASSATVDTPTDLGGNTWRFPVSGITQGQFVVSLASNPEDIQDLGGNDLEPAPTSWNYTATITLVEFAMVQPSTSVVRVIFSTDMTDDAALINPANYTFTGEDDAMTATTVTRVSATEVDVTVTGMLDAGSYTVYVETGSSGPTDLSDGHIDSFYNNADFTGYGPPRVFSVLPAADTAIPAPLVDIDITFSRSVTGVDVSDLILSGDATTSGAVVGEPTNQGGSTWRFPVTGLDNGSLDISLAPDPDDIEDLDGTDLSPAPTTWSYTVDITKVENALERTSTRVRVVFNESMTDDAALLDPANYTFTGDGVTLTATAVERVLEARVAVTVNEMTNGAAYTVHVEAGPTGPTDLDGNHVYFLYNSESFTGIGDAPTGTITINSDEGYTTETSVTLTLTYDDGAGSGVSDMRFSNDGTTWSNWESVLTSKSWTLDAADGLKTVYAQFRDLAGNVSTETITDDIMLDATLPSVIDNMPDTPTPTNGDSAIFLITFDEAVNNFDDIGDLLIVTTNTLAYTGVSVAYVDAGVVPGSVVYSVTVTGVTGDGNLSFAVSTESDVTDAVGNAIAPNDPGLAATFDHTPPTAVIEAVNTEPTPNSFPEFTVTFNETVSPELTQTDIQLAGTLFGTVSVEGSAPEYTVTVTLDSPDANGTIGIEVLPDTITDLAGNAYAGGSSALATIHNWPGFVVEPESATLYTGDSHTLEVQIGDDGGVPVSYQWKHQDENKAIIDGPTTALWTLDSVSTADSGTYWCDVDFGGEQYSCSTATVQVEDTLVIDIPPVGGTVLAGEPFAFTVEVSGGYTPLNYQWTKNGLPVPSDTSEPTLTLAATTVDDTGTYIVTVSDALTDSIESSPVQLIVNVIAEGEGEAVEGEGETGEGEGEAVEGEGEAIEGEGEAVEGEGETVEGEGEAVEGEGETVEGEGEAVEGEGETVEGEGEAVEGEGETGEGEGETGEGEGETGEGEGETGEGEGETVEGEGETVEGEGETVEGEGETVEGEGETVEGEGETVEGEGETVEGEGETVEGEGETVEGEGETVEGEGETVEGEGEGELDIRQLLNNFDAGDINDDERLSFEEAQSIISGLTEVQFSSADINGDNLLDRCELGGTVDITIASPTVEIACDDFDTAHQKIADAFKDITANCAGSNVAVADIAAVNNDGKAIEFDIEEIASGLPDFGAYDSSIEKTQELFHYYFLFQPAIYTITYTTDGVSEKQVITIGDKCKGCLGCYSCDRFSGCRPIPDSVMDMKHLLSDWVLLGLGILTLLSLSSIRKQQ